MNTKFIIIDYTTSTIEIIGYNSINWDCLENEHDNCVGSYLTEEHGYNDSTMHYMETDRITITHK